MKRFVELGDLQGFADVFRSVLEMNLDSQPLDRSKDTQQPARDEQNARQIKRQCLATMDTNQFCNFVSTLGEVHVVENGRSSEPNHGQFASFINLQNRRWSTFKKSLLY